MTVLSNFSSGRSGGRFAFQPNANFRFKRVTSTLRATYYVAEDFEEHYPPNTREFVEFERQVDVYHIHNLHSQCDYQEKLMYKKVMIAKRRGTQEDLEAARNAPRP